MTEVEMAGTTGNATLALLGGQPVGAPPKPRYPRFTARALERVSDLLQTGPMVGLSNEHPQVGEAEAAIARWHGVERCLTTASGHGALHAALIGLGNRQRCRGDHDALHVGRVGLADPAQRRCASLRGR